MPVEEAVFVAEPVQFRRRGGRYRGSAPFAKCAEDAVDDRGGRGRVLAPDERGTPRVGDV